MIQFLFEDKKKQLLSIFYERSYSKNVADTFHYANGNSKIADYIDDNFSEEDFICIFLDLAPGNRDIRNIYRQLTRKRQTYKNLVVIPIICREYYYLKSLENTSCIVQDNWYRTCINLEPACTTKPSIFETESEDREYHKFEGLCKLVTRKALRRCATTNISLNGAERHRPYLYGDCICDSIDRVAECNIDTLREKSNRFVAAFPGFPAGSTLSNTVRISWGNIILMHRELVDRYNEISDRMKALDTDERNSYGKIEYMI
jgi:hypothetical protein